MDVKTWNFNQFANSLQKARNYADKFNYRCCCPDCGEIAIKSHLLQRHPLLTSIADSQNKVLQFEDNWEDARSGRWNFYSEKARGIWMTIVANRLTAILLTSSPIMTGYCS